MELGARFVCAKCRLRGPARVCPGCAQERLDVTAPEGLEALRRGWPMFPAWERGLSFLSPRSIPLNRRVVRLALAATACVALGPVIAAATGREGQIGGIGLALAVSLVASPLLASFFAVFRPGPQRADAPPRRARRAARARDGRRDDRRRARRDGGAPCVHRDRVNCGARAAACLPLGRPRR